MISFDWLVITCSLLALVASLVSTAFVVRFIKGTPDLIQTVLTDVGEELGEKFNEIFGPVQKRAYSQMAEKSHQSRASNALREKVAKKLVPMSVQKVLDYLDITPEEGIELMHDPFIGPIIQGGLGKMLGGGINPRTPRIGTGQSHGVPEMR